MNNFSDPEGSTRSTEDGIKELQSGYSAWSASLANYSVEATYAVIVANWAVHSRTVLNNGCALLSIIICIVFLAFNILLVWIITELHCSRLNKALSSHAWWIEQHKMRKYTRWPYTQGIESTAFFLRIVKGLVPVLAGTFFILSVL